MFIHTPLIFLLIMFIYLSSYGQASKFGSDGKYLSHIRRLSRAIDITNTSKNGENNYNFDTDEKYYVAKVDSIFNILSYGAKGDGDTDDTKAFQAAWVAACKVESGLVVVPSGYTFLLQPITFKGDKCQPNPTFKVEGRIVAPEKSKWKNMANGWIIFTGFGSGLKITGSGMFIGRGEHWWSESQSDRTLLGLTNFDRNGYKIDNKAPHALMIKDSMKVHVTGIKIQDSPRMHIYFDNCQHVTIVSLHLKSPEHSPNTDGIHLFRTQDVNISHSNIACGDDCISIQTGCSDIKIFDVYCGPGHGYSIGSLGYNKEEALVSNINIYNSIARGTMTGLRIKTWKGAKGTVHGVRYENIKMYDVKLPIIIDQSYCYGHDFCHYLNETAVAISDVKYKNITGTYTKSIVALVCSEYNPCRDVWMSELDLNPSEGMKPSKKNIRCSNAHGKVLPPSNPPLEKCLLSS